jgi:hypothetical protein
MSGLGPKFLCPHCARSGGGLGGLKAGITAVVECDRCVEDYRRVREVEALIHAARQVKGLTPPQVFMGLWKAWCEVKGYGGALEKAHEIEKGWVERDRDQPQVGAGSIRRERR